jgi:hypothetical protein
LEKRGKEGVKIHTCKQKQKKKRKRGHVLVDKCVDINVYLPIL